MDGLIGILGVVAILWAASGAIAVVGRGGVRVRWLVAASALIVLNDALLTRGYGLIPDLLGGEWNWQGKLMATAASLAVAALPVVGWRASALTLRQAPGGLAAAVAVGLVYMAFFTVLALVFPGDAADAETIAFQMTLPGLEEEIFYRGVLLVMLTRAFVGRLNLLGVDWSWGALLTCVLFGLAHAFGYSVGAFTFDPLTLGLTAVPSLLAVWLALRTRSVLIPIGLHNFGNTVMTVL